MNDAILWSKAGDGQTVVCGLCSHRCRISPGRHGRCAVRVNDGGTLRTYVYGRAIAEHNDPIEKKPLYHFLPASDTLSIAAVGCNFTCAFCQNWSISQAVGFRSDDGGMERYGRALDPQKVVKQALGQRCKSVSFTYSEPTVFFEYALDTAKLAKEAGLKTALVSNGYMTAECLETIRPYLDACNIDLKAFSEKFYKDHCGAELAPVLDTLKNIRAAGIWLEVTTLVIPGENDGDEELGGIARFIAEELGPDTPWHVSRFYPQHRLTNRPPTDPATIAKAVKIGAAAGLRYVYAGNTDTARDTKCHGCKATVITRQGYNSDTDGIDSGGRCKSCGVQIAGIF